MDLRHLVLSAPDPRGYRILLGIRKDAAAAAMAAGEPAVDPNLLRLVPGTRVEGNRMLLPCNVERLHSTSVVPLRSTTPSGLVLRDYQVEAVQFIEDTPRGCLVADDVGTGKSIATTEYLHRHPELRPFVVIGPLIASGAWVGASADPEKHYNMQVVALRSRKPGGEHDPKVDGYFCNYQILAPWNEKKLDGTIERHAGWLLWITNVVRPKVVIVDESHECRNYRNTYAKAVHKLCQLDSIHKRIFLSATPVVNKIVDLWYQLDSVQPGLWGHLLEYNEKIITSFGSRYCAAHHNGFGWDLSGESNTVELRERLGNVMIRRSRFDVRKELPPFERQRIDVAPETLDPAAYDEYRVIADQTTEILRQVAGGVLQGHELQRLTGMFNQLSWAKRHIAVERAEAIARSVENRKVLVFTWFKRTASHIVKALRKQGIRAFGPVTGETPIAQRNRSAEEFRDCTVTANSGAVFVATLGAAGQSLNPLAAASVTLFTDLWYVPNVLLQAEGRTHREGQRSSRVLAQYLVVDGTIDTIMWTHLQNKAKQIAAATGDSAAMSLAESLGGRNEEESLQALVQAMTGLSAAALELT